jgi:hypothetical protein
MDSLDPCEAANMQTNGRQIPKSCSARRIRIGIFLVLGLAAGMPTIAGEPGKEFVAANTAPEPVGTAAMRLANLPYLRRAKMFQWSSFSHPSANDPDFYYPDPHAKGFKVLIDIKGPGSLNHWWSTGGMSAPVGLKFYFDDEETPRLSTTIGKWCGGCGPLGQADGPSVNFVPMPFRTRCVVSTDGPRGEAFHHAYAYTFPTAEGITTFTGKEDLSEIQATWRHPGTDPKPASGDRTVTGKVAIAAGRAVTVYDRRGQETIASLKVDPAPRDKGLLKGLWIRAYWDGSRTPQVCGPLSYFFGAADLGESAVSRAVPVGMRLDGPWYFYFPMPYWTSARIEIENRSKIDCRELGYEIRYAPKSAVDYPKEQCAYFCAHFAAGTAQGPENFMVLEAEGTGHVVGVVKGPGFLGENDEMVYIDDNLTPQSWGTGGEDYPLFCYGMRTESHPVWGGTQDWRYYRYHLGDTINFQKNIRFGFEHGEDCVHGWLKPNRDKIYIETLCMYYLNPAANLLQTDEVDVGDPQSEKEHDYTVRGQTWRGASKAAYQGEETVLTTDNGRKFDGYSEFRVKINPHNDGVRLRRRMLQTQIQEAKVYVDGAEVTDSRFYSPIHYKPGNGFYDTNQLWRDVEFEIPARYTKNKSTVTLKIENAPSATPQSGSWSEYHYWVYSYTRVVPHSNGSL